MKTITDDPDEFFSTGGWNFLSQESDVSNLLCSKFRWNILDLQTEEGDDSDDSEESYKASEDEDGKFVGVGYGMHCTNSHLEEDEEEDDDDDESPDATSDSGIFYS